MQRSAGGGGEGAARRPHPCNSPDQVSGCAVTEKAQRTLGQLFMGQRPTARQESRSRGSALPLLPGVEGPPKEQQIQTQNTSGPFCEAPEPPCSLCPGKLHGRASWETPGRGWGPRLWALRLQHLPLAWSDLCGMQKAQGEGARAMLCPPSGTAVLAGRGLGCPETKNVLKAGTTPGITSGHLHGQAGSWPLVKYLRVET